MTLILSGTDGVSDVDGSAATPAVRGADANTGIFFPAADTIAFSEGGAEVARITNTGAWSFGASGTATGTSGQALVSAGSGAAPAWGTLAAAGGGTGLTTPGTSGNVLTSNGSAWVSSPVAASGVNVQTFTSSGTWTKPSLAAGSRVLIQAWGGGGSGAKGTNRNGGGGGGGYMEKWETLSSMGSTETITVGAGGAAQAALSTSGNSGGNTTVGSILTAYGGGGGVSGAASGVGGGGGGEFTSGGSTFGSIGGGGNIDASNGYVRTISAAQQNGVNFYQSRRTGDAFTIYGGGAGGTFYNDGENEFATNGGRSIWGGAGGGSSGGTSVRSDAGTSLNGGNGGAAGSTGTAGSAPAGGGGASWSGNSGAGARGQVIITVFPA